MSVLQTTPPSQASLEPEELELLPTLFSYSLSKVRSLESCLQDSQVYSRPTHIPAAIEHSDELKPMEPTLGACPDEILEQILVHLENPVYTPPPYWSLPDQHSVKDADAVRLPDPALYALALVSKRMSRLSQPSMYRALKLQGSSLKGLVQMTRIVALVYARGENLKRFKHVQELEINLYNTLRVPLLSALTGATRLTLRLQPLTSPGNDLVACMAGMENLQFLVVSSADARVDDTREFLSQVVSRSSLARSGCKGEFRVSQLSMLELQHVDVSELSQEISSFVRHFQIPALSLWSCDIEFFDFRSLINTGVSKLSLHHWEQAACIRSLSDLQALSQLDALRVGYMHEGIPANFLGAIPAQLGTFQLMFRGHPTLEALFSRIIEHENYLPNLVVLEIQEDSSGLLGNPVTLDSSLANNLYASRAKYSAYLRSCRTALQLLRERGTRTHPPALLEKLERCAKDAWGIDWQEVLEGPIIDAEAGDEFLGDDWVEQMMLV